MQLSLPGSRQELHDSPPRAKRFSGTRDKYRSIKTITQQFLPEAENLQMLSMLSVKALHDEI
jgi:hypothetical protein